MVRIASCQPTLRSETRTVPLTVGATTMLRPLNSERARMTVRMSAPSTSTVKVPEPVRTRPTCFIADGCCASAADASTIVRTRPRRALAVRIRLFSLPRDWNRNRLGLPVDGDVDDHRFPFETLDVAVHHSIATAQHVAVAARVLDHRELIVAPPHHAHQPQPTQIGRRLPADVRSDVLAFHQRLE